MKLALGIGTLVVGLAAFGGAYLLQGAGSAAPLCGGSCPSCPATQAAPANLAVPAPAAVLLDAPAATQPVDVKNTKCLIESKEDVTDGLTYIHEGKLYHFCCKDCIPPFQKDPAKYIKDLTEHPEKYGIKK
ncbi:MAG: hypothetical protein WCI73_07030 [Phycisphaerae bacterium]